MHAVDACAPRSFQPARVEPTTELGTGRVRGGACPWDKPRPYEADAAVSVAESIVALERIPASRMPQFWNGASPRHSPFLGGGAAEGLR